MGRVDIGLSSISMSAELMDNANDVVEELAEEAAVAMGKEPEHQEGVVHEGGTKMASIQRMTEFDKDVFDVNQGQVGHPEGLIKQGQSNELFNPESDVVTSAAKYAANLDDCVAFSVGTATKAPGGKGAPGKGAPAPEADNDENGLDVQFFNEGCFVDGDLASNDAYTTYVWDEAAYQSKKPKAAEAGGKAAPGASASRPTVYYVVADTEPEPEADAQENRVIDRAMK